MLYPKISIIIPTFNASKTLEESILSVINQTYQNIELIVVDGNSTDGTLEILKKHSERVDALISERDKGVYDAMNKGIKIATGNYLYFLGSDDTLYTSTIIEEIFSDQSNHIVDLLYGNVLFKHSKWIHSGESSLKKLLDDEVSICHQAIFYSRKVFDIIGDYNIKYYIHADYEYNIKCFEHKEISKKYVDKIIALYNETGLSGTQSNADGFLSTLKEQYVTKCLNPLDLYYENKRLKEELYWIKKSRTYRASSYIIQRIKWLKK